MYIEGLTGIYTICVRGSSYRSQNSNISYSNVFAVIRMQRPKGRVLQSDVGNDDVARPHYLDERSSGVV